MKHLLIIAGVAALATTAPAFAKPDHAKGHKGHHAKGHVGSGTGGWPRGLANNNNGCLPPGQAKKLYNIGQRWPGNYGHAWNYNQIPYDLRSRYDFDDDYRYYYGDGYLYQVDPATMLISQVVSAILR
jgi:opacity protein-like surface antigen